MMDRSKEAFYLAATIATGAYIAGSLAELLSSRYTSHNFPIGASYCSPWLAVLLVPAQLVARARHAMLRGMRIHKAQPALVYPHSDPILGLDWLRLMKGALATNSVLETWHEMLTRTVGQTYWYLTTGSWMLMTNEPGNIKAILSTQFDTLSSMFWELARRPEVVRKIRDEVNSLDGRRPTWEELKGLKYLNNVLKEALRLWAPVATNSRAASKDTVLPNGGGKDGQAPLFVPKGTSCRFTMYSLHRRKDVYGDDAEEFRPERWDTIRTSWEYVPFSGGPRICIGQQFALTMMLYLTTRFFQTFDKIEARDELPMVQQASTTIKLVHGCWVSLTPV